VHEAVAAPAGQMGGVEREVGQVLGGRLVELAGGEVQGGVAVATGALPWPRLAPCDELPGLAGLVPVQLRLAAESDRCPPQS
jgi:hypothetical protein